MLLFALAVTGAVTLTACGRSGLDPDDLDAGLRVPGPFGFPGDGETPTPSPTPRFGTGADGDLFLNDSDESLNTCSALLATSGGGNVFVDSAGGFAPKDRVLLLQVQGRFSVSNDPTPITVLDSAGRWEIAEVVAVEGTSLRLAPGPGFVYRSDASSRAQICRMPQYRNVFVSTSGTIGAPNWDGETGGVVAFFVSSTLTIATGGLVDAFNDGFRGGPYQANGNTTGVTATDTSQPSGGRKGEGLDPRAFGEPRYGRGNYANGAGGGNGSDAGGGGGSGGGAGGFGGREFNVGGGGGNLATRGAGGAPIVASLDSRLCFGGGGGAGHSNNGAASDGARGGGIVLIFARTLAGTGEISAGGFDAAGNVVFDDGVGGGGGGGTIRLEVEESTFMGSIHARGGAGADTSDNHGPGGGGGGGRIRLLGISTAGLSALGVEGGLAGQDSTGDKRNATDGAAGVLVTTP